MTYNLPDITSDITCLNVQLVCKAGFPISKNAYWRNQFFSLSSFALCCLKYFYTLVNREGFYFF